MCDVCRKYRCPDGCPNNYVPRLKNKRNGNAKDRLGFTVGMVVCADGENFKKALNKNIVTRKSEIKIEREELYGENFGKGYRDSEN